MNEDLIDLLKFIGATIGGLMLLIAAIVLGVTYGFSRPSCYAHWRDSGYQVRWSVMGDCQISKDGKTWLEDSVVVQTNKTITLQ